MWKYSWKFTIGWQGIDIYFTNECEIIHENSQLNAWQLFMIDKDSQQLFMIDKEIEKKTCWQEQM